MCAQRLSGTATSRVSALLRNGRAALLSPLAGRHCPTVARGGGSLRPFSPPAFLDPGSRQEPSSAHIRLSACAGLPAPWLNHKTPEGGFRTRGLARELLSIQAALGRLPPSCASRSRGIRAFPQGSPRILYQYQLIYYCRYCRIFDTAFRYF